MFEYMKRQEWSPQHGIGNLTPGPQSGVIVHHAPERKLPKNPTTRDIVEQIQIIEDWHAKTLTPTNPRIGYHWIVVEPIGLIVEGLGWGRIGAHVAKRNTRNLGILILGVDGAREIGSAKVWRSIANILQEGIDGGHLVARPELAPHRRYVQTACPGDRLASFVQSLSLDDLLALGGAPAIPTIEPTVTPHVPHGGPLNLQKIVRPTPAHVDEIARVRRLTPDRIQDGVAVVEVLVRGILAARDGVTAKEVADVLADWLKARR